MCYHHPNVKSIPTALPSSRLVRLLNLCYCRLLLVDHVVCLFYSLDNHKGTDGQRHEERKGGENIVVEFTASTISKSLFLVW